LARTAKSTKATVGDKELTITDNKEDWGYAEKLMFLESFQTNAWEEVKKGSKDANALNYLDDEGIGLSLTAVMGNLTEEQMDKAIELIEENYNNKLKLEEDILKESESWWITKYTLDYDGQANAVKAADKRAEGDYVSAMLHSKALLG
jgi:hypothetical protein